MTDAVAVLLQRAVAAGDVPGAVAIAGGPATAARRWVAGCADTTPGAARPTTIDTCFDLASLTKVVATTVLVLGLVAEERLALGDPIARRLPGAAGGHPGVTVERLLTHTAGLPATVRLWEEHATPEEGRRGVRELAPVAEPGTAVVYSDVGFMLLGQLVEAVLGCSLPDAFRRRVAEPLALAATGFGPVAAERAAATELRPDGTPWVGTVHDENARFLGGAAGHAGLFATAADLARFCSWWAGEADGPVPAALRRAAVRCRTEGLDGRRGLGWVCRGDRFDVLEGWPATAVCHTGFTGTSLAVDPAGGRWVVLLTNAVHFGRRSEPIRALRRSLHAALSPDAGRSLPS